MSLPATPAERSRAHFAHGVVHKRRRLKEGREDCIYIKEYSKKKVKEGLKFETILFINGL